MLDPLAATFVYVRARKYTKHQALSIVIYQVNDFVIQYSKLILDLENSIT